MRARRELKENAVRSTITVSQVNVPRERSSMERQGEIDLGAGVPKNHWEEVTQDETCIDKKEGTKRAQ